MNRHCYIFQRISQHQPFRRTAIAGEGTCIRIAHARYKNSVRCSDCPDTFKRGLRTRKPVVQTDSDVTRLVTGLRMRVRLIDQFECQALVPGNGAVDSQRETTPEGCEIRSPE